MRRVEIVVFRRGGPDSGAGTKRPVLGRFGAFVVRLGLALLAVAVIGTTLLLGYLALGLVLGVLLLGVVIGVVRSILRGHRG